MDRLSEKIAKLQRRIAALARQVSKTPRGSGSGGDIQVIAPVNRKVVVNVGSQASRNVGSAKSTHTVRQRRKAAS